MEINITIDKENLFSIEQSLKGFEKQIPFASALGLTKLAQLVKQDERKEMISEFDRPTPFTLNSLFVRRADKKNQQAVVAFKDLASFTRHYLLPQVYGGSRGLKRFEKLLIARGALNRGRYLVPAQGLELNRYGNVNRGKIQKILSGLQAQFDPINNETARSKKRKRSKRKSNDGFFALVHGDQQVFEGLEPGIYERHRFAFGQAVKPLFIAVKKPVYDETFDFFYVAEKSVERNWARTMEDAVIQALRTRK